MDDVSSEFMRDYFRRDEDGASPTTDENKIRSSPESPDPDDHGDGDLVICAEGATNEDACQEHEHMGTGDASAFAQSSDEDSSSHVKPVGPGPLIRDSGNSGAPAGIATLKQENGRKKSWSADGQNFIGLPSSNCGPVETTTPVVERNIEEANEPDDPLNPVSSSDRQEIKCEQDESVTITVQCRRSQRLKDAGTGEEEIRLQVRSQNRGATFLCGLCDDTFASVRAMQAHKKTAHMDPANASRGISSGRSFRCRYCNETIQTFRVLCEHIRDDCQSVVRPHRCGTCSDEFTDYPSLVRHEESHKELAKGKGTSDGKIRCLLCEKVFTSKRGLREHKTVHSGERRFKCEICQKRFRLCGDLHKHIKIHSDDRRYHCKICGATYTHYPGFTKHMESHGEAAADKVKLVPDDIRKKQRRCQYCPRKFTTVEQLTKHERVHRGVKPYKCTHCEQSFNAAQSLLLHTRYHTGERPYQCEVCGKGFVGSGLLRAHERVHTGYRPHVCDVCGKSFAFPRYLTIHRRSHTGEKPFKCDKCDKAYSSNGTLTVHKRTHTGEKPYRCEYCSMAFTSSGALTSHRKKHGIPRPSMKGSEMCNFCGKLFEDDEQLEQHKRIHIGEGQYRCADCRAGFETLHKYKQHRKICPEVAQNLPSTDGSEMIS